MKKRRRAFTLIEVLLAATLSVGLVGIAGSSYLQSERVAAIEADELAVAQNARVLIDRLSRDVRQTTEFAFTLPETVADGASSVEFVDGHEPSIDGPYYLRYELQDGQVWRRRHYYYRGSQPGTRLPFSQGETVYEEGEEGGDTALYRHETEAVVIAESVADLKFWGTANLLSVDVWLQRADGTTEPLHSAVAKRN